MSARPPLAPGLRQTRQRRIVWEAVDALGGHCTADEIASHVQSVDPSLARSTVYRALEALAASGAVHAVRLGGGAVHYELAGEEHQHALCQVCEGVLHIEDDLVHDLEHHLEELHRFRPVRTEVLVVGVCETCARSGGRRPTKRRTLEHVHYPRSHEQAEGASG
ncbi:MAG TPA: Fur family transcriptional regulator [Solirubrobacterales bacterium]|nr:Fur family transcriptional regulator [Solirubrobacterales bacterium]